MIVIFLAAAPFVIVLVFECIEHWSTLDWLKFSRGMRNMMKREEKIKMLRARGDDKMINKNKVKNNKKEFKRKLKFLYSLEPTSTMGRFNKAVYEFKLESGEMVDFSENLEDWK